MSESTQPATPVDQDGTLDAWLHANVGDGGGAFTVAPLASAGESNEMLAISQAGRTWVLRRPPRVRNAPSAHDVLRELRVLRALDRTRVPHARVIATCTDAVVLGVPFYVMDHVDGFTLTEPLDEPLAAAVSARADFGLQAVTELARLALVPWQDVGLDGFGRPEGFLERQVRRWRSQLDRYAVRALPDVDAVGRWLEDHCPATYDLGIVHGDFHTGNVMFAREAPIRVAAIVDWEMATIGDPLIDLGLLLGSWSHPGEERIITSSASRLEGMASRRELLARYEAETGRPVAHVEYYMALALFKLACILEGSYARHLAGDSDLAAHAAYGELVPLIAQRAFAITRGAWGVEGHA